MKTKKEIERPFLSKIIYICDYCDRIDIYTYARYKLKGDKYVIDSAYMKCQYCGRTKELTKEQLETELKGD